jgi:hypothetical protein
VSQDTKLFSQCEKTSGVAHHHDAAARHKRHAG